MGGTPVAVGTATASDICDATPTVTSNAPAVFPLGTTTVTWTATDVSGNSATATQTVTVVDTTPPVVTATASPDYLWPANHKMRQIFWSGTATDICDAAPGEFTIVSIVSDESDNGWNSGDGNTWNDTDFDADGNLYLRAERAARGDGRVYTVTVKSTDASGNTGYATFTVEVPHDSSSHSKKIGTAVPIILLSH